MVQWTSWTLFRDSDGDKEEITPLLWYFKKVMMRIYASSIPPKWLLTQRCTAHTARENWSAYGIIALFSDTFMYVNFWSLLNMHIFLPVCGCALLEYTRVGEKHFILYCVIVITEEKCYLCVFARSHVIQGVVCLWTESQNQGQVPGGTTFVVLSNPVILKPSPVTECLESLFKNQFLGSTQDLLNQNLFW